jgi:5-methylthioribose kinase
VEVKRSSDTRIRREVVGQMLDYAANAVVYWPLEMIRAKFEAALLVMPKAAIRPSVYWSSWNRSWRTKAPLRPSGAGSRPISW